MRGVGLGAFNALLARAGALGLVRAERRARRVRLGVLELLEQLERRGGLRGLKGRVRARQQRLRDLHVSTNFVTHSLRPRLAALQARQRRQASDDSSLADKLPAATPQPAAAPGMRQSMSLSALAKLEGENAGWASEWGPMVARKDT